MEYICLVYQQERKLDALSDREMDALKGECGGWIEDLEEGGHHIFSSGLQSVHTATTLRNRRGKLLLTDGPFAETREVLRGLTVIEARDLNEAIRLASKLPAARMGSVEIRPLTEPAAPRANPGGDIPGAEIHRRPSETEPSHFAVCSGRQPAFRNRFPDREHYSAKDNIMDSIVTDAKAEFTRAKDRLVRCLATTPDDKINWAPAGQARTPIQLVGHVARATAGIQGMLNGQPLPFTDLAEFDAKMRKEEKEFTSREQVLSLLEESSAAYLKWLDTLTAEQIAVTKKFPFGEFPMAAAITFAADHTRNHAAQLEYIQTTYGDFDWHM